MRLCEGNRKPTGFEWILDDFQLFPIPKDLGTIIQLKTLAFPSMLLW